METKVEERWVYECPMCGVIERDRPTEECEEPLLGNYLCAEKPKLSRHERRTVTYGEWVEVKEVDNAGE